MTTRAVERVDEWPSEPFPGGYAALHDLADDEFSGIVQVGRARLCMLGGTVVGILEGDIGDFENDGGTTYEAPSPALPLLALMQERNDTVKAKYYTEDTPISEIDDTLSNGNFSGFIELSENVLSGDYYLVYHAGRSMAVAFVGNTKQLLMDDEAFDRADGEVGIYQVRPAEVEPIDIPEVERESGTDSTDDGSTGAVPDDGSPAGDATGRAPSDASTTETDTDTDSPATATGTGDDTADRIEETTDTSADDTAAASTDSSPAEPEASVVDDTARSEVSDGADVEPTAGSDHAERRDTTTESDDAEAATDSAEARGRSDEGTSPAGTGGETRRDNVSRTSVDTGGDDAGRTSEDTGGDEDTRRDEGTRGDDDGRADDGTQEPSRGRGETRRDDSSRDDADDPEQSVGSRSERAGADDDGRRTGDRRDTERGGSRERSTGRQSGRDSTTRSTPGRGSRANADPSSGRSAEGSRSGGTGAPSSGGISSPDQLETRAIPSLDPSRSSSQRDTPPVDPAAGRGGPGPAGTTGPEPEVETDRQAPTSESSAGPEPEGNRRHEARDASDTTDASPARSEDASTRKPESRETVETNARATGSSPTRPEQPDDQTPTDHGGESAAGTDHRVAELESELADVVDELEAVEDELASVQAQRDELQDERETLRTERDRLREERDALRTERDELERERDDLQAEVDDLSAELDTLESQLEQLEAQHGAAPDAEKRLTPTEALDQTNLFIRYESKGRATLETAHDGNASKQEVNENLGLEYHTQFDAATASVGGQTFEAFLTDTIQYRFVTWLINNLLYEIRDTGKIAAMQDLYDAIPRIDRAELNGTINAEFAEDGQERRAQESFDVVLRDRMGNPLLVANLNDSRQAATENMMSSLITASTHVGQSEETLSAAFLVTSSFFEPEALESASEATSGGLLSRDKRESFVKLARKQGFHLCLVEAREEKFHLAVPEL